MLQAESVSFYLEKKALINNISLTFYPGNIYGIMGPNGSGKSTFLKTLSGIWTPSSGKVLWNGENLLLKERREISKIITLVQQTPPILFEFTATEFVMMGLYAHARESSIDWALVTVDAWHLRNRKINHLSHGERQRIYIARALVTESPILLLDEPTSNLDFQNQSHIWNLLHVLKEQNKTLIITSHDLTAVHKNCDEISYLEEGFLVKETSSCLAGF